MSDGMRVFRCALAIVTLSGCGHPHVSPSPGVELPEGYVHSIALQNGDVLTFDWFGHGQWSAETSKNAPVEGDNVVGYVDGQRTEIHLADIQDIQYRRPAYMGMLVITAIVGTLAFFVWWFGSSGYGGS